MAQVQVLDGSRSLGVGAELDSRNLPVARLARLTDRGLATAGAAIIALRDAERDRLHRSLETITGKRALVASALRVVVKPEGFRSHPSCYRETVCRIEEPPRLRGRFGFRALP
jgi:hypothetical protein